MKKNKKITISIICLACLLLIILIINLFTDKTKIFKTTVSNLNTKIIEGLDKNNIDFLNFKKSTNLNLILNKPGNTTDKLTLNGNIDKENNLLNIKANYNNYDLGLYKEQSKIYLKSDSILDKVYNLNLNIDSGCKNNCSTTLDDYINLLTSNFNYDTNTFKTMVNGLSKEMNKSFKNRYASKSKENITVADKDIKATKYSYKINNKSLKVLINNIDKNRDLKDNLFNLFGEYFKQDGITKDNFKDLVDNISGEGTFNIYLDNNKIVLITINLGNTVTIRLEFNDNNINFELYNNGNSVKLTGSANLDKETYSVNIYSLDNLVLETTFSNSDNLNLDVTLHHEDKVYPINITNKSNKDGNKTNGVFTFKYKTYNYEVNYTIEENVDITSNNFSNVEDITKITDIDISKLDKDLEEIEKSDLIKSMIDLYNEIIG